MKVRSIVSAAVVSCLSFALVSCGSSESKNASSDSLSLENVTLRVGEIKNGEFQWAAETSKKFDGAPYNVEFVYFESSPDMLAALDAGAIDIAPMVQVPALVSAQGNAKPSWTADDAPLRVVAAWSSPENPGWVVLSNDPGLTDAAGLAGRKLAYTRGAFGQVFWINLKQQNSLEGVEEVQLPYIDALTAFQEGAVDALITSYRFGAAVEARGAGTIIETSADIVDYAAVTVARSAILESADIEAAVRDFIGRIEDAFEWAKGNVDPVAQFFVDNMSLSQEVAVRVAPSEFKQLLPLGDTLTTLMTLVVEALVEGGVVPESVDPTVVFDSRFE